MVRAFVLCAVSVVAVGLPPLATWAADTAGRSLAANCTGCHGPNGVSTGDIPSIARMEKQRMVELMQAFRDGKKEATVMQQHAKGYSDEQIEAIAQWFASQK